MALIRFIDLIPSGADNAIKRAELVKLADSYGFIPEGQKDKDRFVRGMIENARKKNVIICKPRGGYYVPTVKDKDALKVYIAGEKRRAQSIYAGIKIATNVLEDLEHGRPQEVKKA